jgi:HK97 gp10 family phage protein
MLDEKGASKLVKGKIKNLDGATRAGIRLGLYNLGTNLKKTASKEMLDKKSKRGRLYRYKGRPHRASAPGQTAANRSGTLRKSINFAVQGSEGLTFGARASYAAFLEQGTSKMLPRPTLQNSMKANYIVGANYIEQGIEQKADF